MSMNMLKGTRINLTGTRVFMPFLACLIYLSLLGFPPVFAADNPSSPRIVVSIKPLHSIVAGVMQGVATPYLIVDGSASPHTYTLKPSAARKLQDAQAIFWAGDNVETFLIKPLVSLGRNAKIVALSKIPGIQLWPLRSGEKWQEQHEHAAQRKEHEKHEEQQEHADHETAEIVLHNIDPHVWLDPTNVMIMVDTIVHVLTEVDPQHAAQYLKNGKQTKVRLKQLDQTLMSSMKKVSHHPYMVFHDAYQYFEKHYNLKPVGSIVFQMEQTSSAKRLRMLHNLIKNNNVRCVFSEPEFSTKKVNALVRGTHIKTGVLDPLGANLSPGPDLYFTMMNGLGDSIKACLDY